MEAPGAHEDRPGLTTLLSQSEERAFEMVLADDLSLLARDNFLMLSILTKLRFQGVRVVSIDLKGAEDGHPANNPLC